MRRAVVIIFIISGFTFLSAQTVVQLDGFVSYISAKTVYVKFDSTKGIETGDTLFQKTGGNFQPAVIVKYISSKSAAGEAVDGISLKINNVLTAFILLTEKNDITVAAKISADSILSTETSEEKTHKIPLYKKERSEISGRLSVQSYSGFNNFNPKSELQRWRYSLLFNADRIAKSDVSFSSYIIFTYKTNEWKNITKNFFIPFRVYDLAAKYNLSDDDALWIGRHLNNRISNVGPVDGIQFEKKLGDFFTGIILGSRPDYTDLSFNLKLFEYGGFISRTDTLNENYFENSLAVFKQTNNSKPDRSFIYYQHSNNLLPKTNLFFSTEIDLFKREKGKAANTFSFTSLFLSARFAPSRIISFNLSYDALKNVIYYESFRNFTDSLIENESRQGLRFGMNVRPVNNFYSGFTIGYRYKPGDKKPSKNFNLYSTLSRVPALESALTFNFMYLINSFLEGNIIGFSLNKDLPFNNAQIMFTYRRSNYRYIYSGNNLKQDNVMIDLSSRLFSSLYFNISWDGVFEKERSYGRILLGLTTRF